ncbi:MAG: ComF family protein [Ekhidna sp.]
MWSDFISLIFPQNCVNCQQSLISEEKFLCTICKIDLPYTNDHINDDNELFRKFVFEQKVKSASAFMYFYKGGVAQKLLYELKYNGKKEIGSMIGEWYGKSLIDIPFDMIIPVPLHKSKLRKRGYNQSDSIAEGIGIVSDKQVKSDLVFRQIATTSQTRKSKIDRWKNIENVYSTVKEDLSNTSVLVVDDVITTGATVGMLCSRLSDAGVSEIHIATVARAK